MQAVEAVANPFTLFTTWYTAWKLLLPKNNPQGLFYSAMSLSTTSMLKGPQCRIVLLKDFSEAGFVFGSNYSSAKGVEIAEDPRVSLCFYWGERQIWIARGRDKRISAISSAQSREIESREALEKKREQVEAANEGIENPERPADWGGYVVKPVSFEFWSNSDDRFHERAVYSEGEGNTWSQVILQP